MKEQKLKNFANDEAMNDAVYSEVLGVFLKARAEKDVHYLAAKSLAVEFLNEAWRVLNNYKNYSPDEVKPGGQVGL